MDKNPRWTTSQKTHPLLTFQEVKEMVLRLSCSPVKSARTKISTTLEFFVNWNTKDTGRSPRSPIRPICETCSARSRAGGRWDFQFIEGRSRILPAGLISPLWWANLVWPLLPSPVSRVQITVHQSGGFVTVELWQRRNSWTWTSTTRGITGPSVETWARIDFCFFLQKIQYVCLWNCS